MSEYGDAMDRDELKDLRKENKQLQTTIDFLWGKIEAITRLVNKACLKLKMSAYPQDSKVADQVIEELMLLRGPKGEEDHVSKVAQLQTTISQQEEKFEQHTKHVSEFLREMYAVMIDPLDSSDLKVAEMTATLLDAAKRDRETANLHADALGTLRGQLDHADEIITQMEKDLCTANEQIAELEQKYDRVLTSWAELKDHRDQLQTTISAKDTMLASSERVNAREEAENELSAIN
jgi:CII-binding regulator of phage lambda lysogenization HflD